MTEEINKRLDRLENICKLLIEVVDKGICSPFASLLIGDKLEELKNFSREIYHED